MPGNSFRASYAAAECPDPEDTVGPASPDPILEAPSIQPTTQCLARGAPASAPTVLLSPAPHSPAMGPSAGQQVIKEIAKTTQHRVFIPALCLLSGHTAFLLSLIAEITLEKTWESTRANIRSSSLCAQRVLPVR